ncbi:cytochrome P450 [Sphingomonas crocodyli]|uniref:Cytochrome P450 n=1 Tax=Sphingomonas crocodyli TaxID=1979270 RepID=A0A437MB57_9SPHN|nr:cytochrome P450 [Sphingomonas crocodyli]RVT94877.1 cytochrome P450 [Sphingomonas crocodyli]
MGELREITAADIPAHVPPGLVIPFDFRRDFTTNEDVWSLAEAMNDRPDIFWSPDLGGYWVATRAPIIEEVFRRHELFSNRSVMIPPMMSSGFGIVNTEDPPDHARFRSILATTMFSPRALAGVEEAARQVTREIIDSFASRGSCDFAAEFARPMPVDVFMGMFGMDRDRRMAFVPWVEQFFRSAVPEERFQARDAILGLLDDWIDRQIADPSTAADGHIMPALLAARPDGRPVTKQEMMALCFLLVNGALDTTTAQMTHQMRFIAGHPAHRDALIADPSLIPHAVEVMLRRFGMINTGRMVRDDVEFHGVQMKAGEMVLCSTVIAGMDKAAYPAARDVSFDKGDGRVKHWAFGSGIHICPGAYLARMELRILLEEALPRLRNLRLSPKDTGAAVSGITVALPELHIEWDV